MTKTKADTAVGVWAVLRLGRTHLVVMRPNAAQLGHLGLEMMMGVRLAKCFRAPLWILRPEQVVDSAPYELISDEVRITVFRGWLGSFLTWLFFSSSPKGLIPKNKPLVYTTISSYFLHIRMQKQVAVVSRAWHAALRPVKRLAGHIWKAYRKLRKGARERWHSVGLLMRRATGRLASASENNGTELKVATRSADGSGAASASVGSTTSPARPKKAKKEKPKKVAKAAILARSSGATVVRGSAKPHDAHRDQRQADIVNLGSEPSRARDEIGNTEAILIRIPDKARTNPTYFKRLWVDQVRPFRIPDARLPALQAQVEKDFGIRPETRIVALHMREPGFKAGREIHEAKPGSRMNDSARNVSLASYEEPVRYLVEQGYTVIRIGDPSMTPVEIDGLIDLATSPNRTDLIELYLVSRCDFFIGCESGASILAWLCGKPVLTVNSTEPLSGSYPVRDFDIYILKQVRDRRDGSLLDVLSMLHPDYLNLARNIERFEYVDNSAEDILDAVKDMIEIVKHGVAPETPEQRAFRLRALGVGVRLRIENYVVRKWGPHQGFMGRGRIAPTFARKYMRSRTAHVPSDAADRMSAVMSG